MKKQRNHGRYFAKIKHIINSVAKTNVPFDLRWYDYEYLAQTINVYLNAKRTTRPLSGAEEQFIKSTASFADNMAISGFETFYINPDFSKIDQLQTLVERERKYYDSMDLSDRDFATFNKISTAIRRFSAGLTTVDLQCFTLTPHSDWLTAPYSILSKILPAYAKANSINTSELTAIFGERLVSAYWNLSIKMYPDEPVYTFLDLIDTEGDWLLDLNDLLTPDADPNITSLTILWLKWFKHEKTFNGFEVQSGAQMEIRAAKEIINLLVHRQYSDARQKLLMNVNRLWD